MLLIADLQALTDSNGRAPHVAGPVPEVALEVIRRGRVGKSTHVLKKPFNASELARGLRETLEDAPPEPGSPVASRMPFAEER